MIREEYGTLILSGQTSVDFMRNIMTPKTEIFQIRNEQRLFLEKATFTETENGLEIDFPDWDIPEETTIEECRSKAVFVVVDDVRTFSGMRFKNPKTAPTRCIVCDDEEKINIRKECVYINTNNVVGDSVPSVA